jgi:hypothetical protein
MHADGLSLEKGALPPFTLLAFEKMLAESLRTFMAELCFTNAGVIMAYISSGQQANIEDILASSAELCLKPGHLVYRNNATFESDWGLPPQVSIDLRLLHSALRTDFKVIFDDSAIGVDIDCISFNRRLNSLSESLDNFADALSEMRLARQ